MILALAFIISCSSIKDGDQSGEGTLDKAMRDKDCGLLSNFYNKCGKKDGTEAPASTPATSSEDVTKE